jgi:Carbohydrate binding domain
VPIKDISRRHSRQRVGVVAAVCTLAAAGLACVATATTAEAAPANLAQNPGFESGTLAPWSCSGGNGSVVTSPVHSGSYALLGTPTSSDDADCSQTVSVQPGSSYTLSAWVEGSYVYLGDTGTGTSDTSNWTTSSSWTQLSTSFTTGASTTSVTIWLHGWYGQGDYSADDVSLTGPAGAGSSPSTSTSPSTTASSSPTASTSPSAPPSTTPPSTTPPTGSTPPATGGSLGANVIVISPSESVSTIASTLNALGTQQATDQFGTQRYEILFEPGTYGSTASPLDFQVGYYESVEGLGQNPSQVVINGTIDSWNQCTDGVQTECYATDNFWRSISNLTINVTGLTGCDAGEDVWAVSQAAPMRRVDINGNLTLMDYCDGSPGWASGGFIADSDLNGTVENGSQQQYIVRNTDIGGWSNGVWNQVFSGDPGAPAQSFGSTSEEAGGPEPYTTLSNSPTTEEEPYLYTDSSGDYDVFVPSVQTNSSGPSWANGNTPGTSLPLSTFYVVNSSSTVAQINAALAAGDNLLFTPGVYSYAQTIDVTNPDTKIIGLGFATLIPTAGQTTMDVADVSGVNISGLIFDAGPVNSPTLLTIGTQGSTVSHASDPVSVDDVFFRVGGAETGSVTDAFIDNSNNSILDDIWSWRADHGAGAGSWTSDTAATGLTVNGNDVTAYGLAVEHYQQYETVWNGQGGTVIFFQNENPYDVPSQSAWMAGPTQDGYPAFYIPNSVTTFQGYGMGVYSNFDLGVNIQNAEAFEAPNTPGVQFNDLLTVWLNNSGGIESVINGTGAAVSSTNAGPVNLVSYN